MKKRYALLAGLLLLAAAAIPALSDQKSIEQNEKYWNPIGGIQIMADVAEVEPNNSLGTAQALGCGNVFRPASIAVSTPRDTDWVYFDANAGDILTLGTDADGSTGQVGDTRIGLLKGDGTLLASDDDSGPGLYSLISNFVAPYTGRYYGRLAAYGSGTGGYKAFVICQTPEPPPVNDRCDGAIPIPCGMINLQGTTQWATNNYTPPLPFPNTCTRFQALGRDVVYSLNALPGDWVNLAYTSTADGSFYIMTACDSIVTTCVIGEDSTTTGGQEDFEYTFTAPGTYYLVLDSYGVNTWGTWTLTGEYRCVATENRRTTWGRLKSIYR